MTIRIVQEIQQLKNIYHTMIQMVHTFQAALLQRWLLPYFMCPFCPFVQALSVNVSVFTLTAIAVDRHRAITKPLSTHTSKRVAKVIIVIIWVLALILAALWLFQGKSPW